MLTYVFIPSCAQTKTFHICINNCVTYNIYSGLYWVTRWVSDKKQQLLPLHEHLGWTMVFFFVASMLLIFSVFRVFCFLLFCLVCFVLLCSSLLCVLCSMLTRSVDCPFLIGHFVFSHVYFLYIYIYIYTNTTRVKMIFLETCYSLWSTITLSVVWPFNPHIYRAPMSIICESFRQLEALSAWRRHKNPVDWLNTNESRQFAILFMYWM